MLSFPKTVQLLHRPQLITPQAAVEYLGRIRALDDRAYTRRANPLSVIARAVGLKKPKAMDDDVVGEPIVEPTKPAAYAPFWLGEPEDEGEYGWVLNRGVGVLNIDTPLMANGFGICGTWFHGYDSIEAAIREMDEDDRVKAIFVRFDTPGGVVAPGLTELTVYLQARAADAKPLWGFCDMCCSAGYWIVAQFDKVWAPALGVVGSIGCVMTHESYAGQDQQRGIKVTAIQFGAHKTDGADWKDLDADAQAHLQKIIDDLGQDFLEAVEAGRGKKLTAEAAKATEARVYQAQHRDPTMSGLELGFVDEIAAERDAFIALLDTFKTIIPEIQPLAKAGVPKPPTATAPVKPAARAATQQETDMKRNDALAAVLKAEGKTAQEKLDEIAKIVAEPSDDAPPADQPADPNTPPAPDAPAAVKPAAPAATAPAGVVNAATARAITELPEAKGREKLAQHLAFTPGMTIDQAKATLEASPKADALGAVMHDPKLSKDGGPQLSDEQKERARDFANAGVPMRDRTAARGRGR